MKKENVLALTTVLVALLLSAVTAGAQVKVGMPMLSQGKSWLYSHHHFEDRYTAEELARMSADELPTTAEGYYKETVSRVAYLISGETTIGDRKYMKLYRLAHNKTTYYAALREDEQGRVYAVFGEQQSDTAEETLLIDFSLKGYGVDGVVSERRLSAGHLTLQRFEYQLRQPDGSLRDADFTAVAGVGFKGGGLLYHPFMPQPDCVCDYETFDVMLDDRMGVAISNSVFDLAKPIELSADQRRLMAGCNDFAWRLMRGLQCDGDMVVSPLSITFALAMLNNGAGGTTRQEINQVLGFGEATTDDANQLCHKLLVEAPQADPLTQVNVANAIFVNSRSSAKLLPSFAEQVQHYYGATPQVRNFYDGQTLDAINQWVSDNTQGMISKVLDKDSFNPSLFSLLLNAIYFKGEWSMKFDAKKTVDEPFDGGKLLPLMHQKQELTYADNDVLQAVKLPYGYGGFEMTVLLPRRNKTVADVLSTLDGESWQDLFRHGHSEIVDLKLPRFETRSSLMLNDVMSQLGMPRAFRSEQAEFPDFCTQQSWIDLMKQDAIIKVDEEGTTAAAVTTSILVTSGLPKEVEFYVDRPFLYVVSECSTGAIFFVGQFTGKGAAAIRPSGTLGVETPTVARQADSHGVYSLTGQRLVAPPTKGIYIIGGKKRVAK